MLDAASAAMRAVESGSVEIDYVVETEGATALGLRIAGDFQAPDRNRFTLRISQGGISITLEHIVIGSDSYVRNPLTGKWEARPESATPFGNLLSYGAFAADFAPEAAAGFTLRAARLNGERVYHVRGPVTDETLVVLLDDTPVRGRQGEVEYWIGVDDSLVRRAEIRAESPAADGAAATKTRVVMTVSDYGKSVNIQAPDP